MGLIKYISVFGNGYKIRYNCSKCGKLIATIEQVCNIPAEIQLSNNNCPNCNERIAECIVIYKPIIDGTKWHDI